MWVTETLLAERYRLKKRIGDGGMGAVWLAHDLTLDRKVAVKTVRAGIGRDARAEARLRREARLLAGVSHPRLARIFDLCESEGGAFIVMEFVDGESLADRITREGRLPADEAARITAQCAGALDAAHRAGVVHRDVKPSNIMLPGGTVKMIDFGIAASLDPSDTTATFGLIGTAAYLAPERASGAQATSASDVYALGVVLYRMLAGQLPFEAEEAIAMLYAHATAAPRALPRTVPPSLAGICLDMLAKDPAARPQAGAVATALAKASVLNRSAARPSVSAARAPAAGEAERRLPEPADAWRPRPAGQAPTQATPVATSTSTSVSTSASDSTSPSASTKRVLLPIGGVLTIVAVSLCAWLAADTGTSNAAAPSRSSVSQTQTPSNVTPASAAATGETGH